MELSTFHEKVIPVEVEWFGETIVMGLRPGVWTTERMYALLFPTPLTEDEIAAGFAVGDKEAQAVADTIASWDITENGKPWAVSPENIKKLPQALIAAIPEALAQHIRDEGKTSPAS